MFTFIALQYSASEVSTWEEAIVYLIILGSVWAIFKALDHYV
jgi:hypothetical protein